MKTKLFIVLFLSVVLAGLSIVTREIIFLGIAEIIIIPTIALLFKLTLKPKL